MTREGEEGGSISKYIQTDKRGTLAGSLDMQIYKDRINSKDYENQKDEERVKGRVNERKEIKKKMKTEKANVRQQDM